MVIFNFFFVIYWEVSQFFYLMFVKSDNMNFLTNMI